MNLLSQTSEFLLNQGVPEKFVDWIAFGIDLLLLILISWLADFLTRKLLLNLIGRIVKKSKAKWDDYFFEQKVFRNLAHLVPAWIVHVSIPTLFTNVPAAIPILEDIVLIYVIVLTVNVINKTLKALENWFSKSEKFNSTPFKTLSQVVRILAYFGALISIISILTGTNATTILGALAGTTAVLLLVFQDSIKGLLANFQIHMYDLIKVGDWISFSKFGVDGDVLSIDLTTVKVQNFDKTVSTVPATAFISESFVNWRGMSESGARRIKRNIHIDITSIRHLDEGLADSLREIDLIHDFMVQRQAEIDANNEKRGIKGASKLNGRRQTNIGLYRKYVAFYLSNHPGIHDEFTQMVRQLQPTTEGLPIEVYCFTNTIVWQEYEGIMADIFDHLYAATRHFDLALFQNPTGADIRAITSDRS